MSTLYTLAVGQGNFAVLQGRKEVIGIDTHLPSQDNKDALYVKAVLSRLARDRNVIGVILTGFDADHAEPQGLGMIVRNFNPDWIMYPKYYKGTATADAVFALIEEERKRKKGKPERISISLKDWQSLLPLESLSDEFSFRAFSPYPSDETSSNNASLVLRVTDRANGRAILITGDTESVRWDNICKYFGAHLASDVLQAPHHGSRTGITHEACTRIAPAVVLISAGHENPYRHPHKEAIEVIEKHSDWYSTHNNDSWITEIGLFEVRTSVLPE